MCRSKNAGVAGYAEAFRPVQSDSQTSEWYSYFENDVLVHKLIENVYNSQTHFRKKEPCSVITVGFFFGIYDCCLLCTPAILKT